MTPQFRMALPEEYVTPFEVAKEIAGRLSRIFLRDESGMRPVYGRTKKFQEDPTGRTTFFSVSISRAITARG